ncbi:MAG TPA: fumarylacetoacetate hydrolase family protein [Solirubrobacteraceae bacterium]|nr:fumarylacetoacetate hydrolase family protein [Solirubrobacteraceae bacterium]
MRLLSYETEAGVEAAIQLGEELVPVAAVQAPARTVRGLLGALDVGGLRELESRAGGAGHRLAIGEVKLRAPVPDAQKLICIGLNYRDHAEESGQDIPAAPMWFAKFANSLIGSGQPIVLPAAHPSTSTTRPSSRS